MGSDTRLPPSQIDPMQASQSQSQDKSSQDMGGGPGLPPSEVWFGPFQRRHQAAVRLGPRGFFQTVSGFSGRYHNGKITTVTEQALEDTSLVQDLIKFWIRNKEARDFLPVFR